MKLAFVVVLGLALTPSGLAAAGTITCGQQVIKDGQRQAPDRDEILAKCGEPTQRESNRWYYERPGEKTKILVFDPQGKLNKITDSAAR